LGNCEDVERRGVIDDPLARFLRRRLQKNSSERWSYSWPSERLTGSPTPQAAPPLGQDQGSYSPVLPCLLLL
jgi:hypothetical protein